MLICCEMMSAAVSVMWMPSGCSNFASGLLESACEVLIIGVGCMCFCSVLLSISISVLVVMFC